MIECGDAVDPFSAKTSTGKDVSLEELRGRAFVAYFYPRSFTPGCTVESRGFAQSYDTFCEHGVEILGVSTDTLEIQCQFAHEVGATFPILDDSGGHVARAFGMGKRPFMGYKRVTFVVDEQGKIEKIFKVGFDWTHHPTQVLDYMKTRSPSE